MPSKCYGCGKASRGDMPKAKVNGEERSYCADCLWKLDKEYKQKKNCDECAHFGKEKCKKTGKTLQATTIGFGIYFTEAENCRSYNTDQQVALEEIRQLELAGRFEDVVAEYERLGMVDEASEARKKIVPIDANALLQTLSKKGQTLTYYCCHCGEPLKIGAKSADPQTVCPKCGGDLEVINLGKLIKQHS
jgi:hypothetical protein